MAGLLEIYSLGGCGGFGMNAALYVAEGRGLLVDFGIGFPRMALPGAALTVPDAAPLAERIPDLAGVVLTHAHDDHCAGLPYLPERWSRAPVYGPGLALATAADRLDDAERPRPRMHGCEPGETVPLGPFRVTFVAMTHSVPDTALLAIDTPAGLVVHSGDFKFDAAPWKGPPVDRTALAALRARGVRLMLVDSTGARREGRTESESVVAPRLHDAVRDATGQVFVSTFASHLHRIEGALAAARATGRKAALLGQRMQRTVRHGIDLGLFDAPAGLLVAPEDLAGEPPGRRLWLAGGCQGEPQSSLSRLSSGTDVRAEVERGDTVVVSASTVPGNEMPVGRMIDRFLRLGAAVRTPADDPRLHVSGHGSRGEIAELLALCAPQVVVPMHGDRAHLEAAAALAEAVDPAPQQVLIMEKGDRIELTSAGARMAERLEIHTTYLDDAGLPLAPGVLRERQQIASTGMAVVRVNRPAHGALGLEQVRIEGLGIPGWETIAPQAAQAALDALRRAPAWTPIADLEADLARRVGNLLRRGNRYRPRVLVFLD